MPTTPNHPPSTSKASALFGTSKTFHVVNSHTAGAPPETIISPPPLPPSIEATPAGSHPSAKHITLDELLAFDGSKDKTRLLGTARRFLCECGSMMLNGESGIGKSSLAMDAAVKWCAGRTFFGINATRPLRILVVQRENDTGDLSEAFQGVMGESGFTDTERSSIKSNLLFIHETEFTGDAFAAWLEDEVKTHRADLVIVDPLMSFAGCNVSDQEMMGKFLRQLIQPVLHRTKAAIIFVHHAGKPGDKSAGDMTDSALKYYSMGSSELTNWPRAIMCLRMVDAAAKVCELSLPKRGDRAGMVDEQGNLASRIYIKHGASAVVWKRAEDYAPNASGGKAAGNKGGAPTKYPTGTLSKILRSSGDMTEADLRKHCAQQGVSAPKGGSFKTHMNKELAAKFIRWRDHKGGVLCAASAETLSPEQPA